MECDLDGGGGGGFVPPAIETYPMEYSEHDWNFRRYRIKVLWWNRDGILAPMKFHFADWRTMREFCEQNCSRWYDKLWLTSYRVDNYKGVISFRRKSDAALFRLRFG